jgi:pimeloyl-ACP methyl ester carboxylesterase
MFIEREGYGYFLRLFVHAQRDKGRSRLGLSPHTIPIAGKAGTLAMFSPPGAYDGYATLMDSSDTFENEVCARLLFMGHARDPREAAKDVQCPVLLLVCEQDKIVAPGSHVKAVQALGDKAIVKSYPIGHFDIYQGYYFERAINEMIAFLQSIL